LEVGFRRAKPAIARSLEIPEEAEVIFRQENGYVDGLRWSRQTSYYPRSLEARAPQLLDTSNVAEGAVTYLTQVGIRQDGYQDSIEFYH
jgi:DNA-binding GntR family transcriptional regulator